MVCSSTMMLRCILQEGVSKHTPSETDHRRIEGERGSSCVVGSHCGLIPRSKFSQGAETVMTPISNSKITLL